MGILNELLAPFNPWYKPPVPTPAELVSQQLAQAERDLVTMEHRKDQVDSDCTMLRARISRLKSRLNTMTTNDTPESVRTGPML
jgi:hypothetical protein